MNRKKLKVRRDDYSRVLLTELLPNEVPLNFSNYGLYLASKHGVFRKTSTPSVVRELFKLPLENLQPFRYKIANTEGRTRVLTIVHPRAQLEFIGFYRDYDSTLLYLCNRSTISLRHPSTINSTYFWVDQLEHGSAPPDDTTIQALSTFFEYRTYRRPHAFLESQDLIRLEKCYRLMTTLDVAKCFSSIYTHSIAWAIKGVRQSKQFRHSKSFESTFDNLMQKSNYDETNGIPIGPETSRIFAEIILQAIDLQILDALRGVTGFEIRRYIDDYMIFSNDPSVEEKVCDTIESILGEYKLYLGEHKTKRLRRPFVTPQSLAVSQIRQFINNLSSVLFFKGTRDEHATLLRRALSHGSSVASLKTVVKQADIEYDAVAKYALVSLRGMSIRFASTIQNVEGADYVRTLQYSLVDLLELMWFIYAMDVRADNTMVICDVTARMMRHCKSWDIEASFRIHDLIFRNSRDVLLASATTKYDGIDALSLLIPLTKFPSTLRLSVQELLEIFPGLENQNLNYFQITTILAYIGKSRDYAKIKRFVSERISQLFNDSDGGPCCTMTFMLFFDVLSCPFIRVDRKRSWVRSFFIKFFNRSMNDSEVNRTVNFCRKRTWFTDWNASDNISFVYLTKTLRQPY